MQRYFIADIHLTDNEPAITTQFFSFLDQLPDGCELYILGDLFDYWIGDDIPSQLHSQVADALFALSKRHIKSYFIQGNRDFLLGEEYCKLCNMTLLPDMQILPLTDKKILIMHGDLLCTDDKQYQKFRRRLRAKWLQKIFLSLPLCFRVRIAKKLREKSILQNSSKRTYLMDVNQQTVQDLLTQNHASILIHGHTHKPTTETVFIDDKPITRIVLSAWHDGISYIKQDDTDGNVKLYYFPIKDTKKVF
ncbi:UDP-2,3-diacylglucosamine diphosphatase [Orbaceae bacterium ESL0721]|nr:UDP-2,3-diacylglucosamine diphosphatase [Orbaceae bacterium ESL0721]